MNTRMNVYSDTTVRVSRTIDRLPPISINISTGTAHVGVYLSPDEARALAGELCAMADEVVGA